MEGSNNVRVESNLKKENIRQFATIPQILVIFHFRIISLNHFHQHINITPIQMGKTLKYSSSARNINSVHASLH